MGGCGFRHFTLLGALWGAPNSLLGLLFAALSWTVPHREGGLLVAVSDHGLAHRVLTRRGFSAMTLGRVVLSAVPITPELLMHEGHHARQYEVLGPWFLPVYLWLHARKGYYHNPLEREAMACARFTLQVPE